MTRFFRKIRPFHPGCFGQFIAKFGFLPFFILSSLYGHSQAAIQQTPFSTQSSFLFFSAFPHRYIHRTTCRSAPYFLHRKLLQLPHRYNDCRRISLFFHSAVIFLPFIFFLYLFRFSIIFYCFL